MKPWSARRLTSQTTQAFWYFLCHFLGEIFLASAKDLRKGPHIKRWFTGWVCEFLAIDCASPPKFAVRNQVNSNNVWVVVLVRNCLWILTWFAADPNHSAPEKYQIKKLRDFTLPVSQRYFLQVDPTTPKLSCIQADNWPTWLLS